MQLEQSPQSLHVEMEVAEVEVIGEMHICDVDDDDDDAIVGSAVDDAAAVGGDDAVVVVVAVMAEVAADRPCSDHSGLAKPSGLGEEEEKGGEDGSCLN